MTAISTRGRARSLLSRVARLAERATTPLLPADYLDLFDPLRSGADLRGRIVAIERETRDAVSVTIRPGRGWAGHVPGQYVRIGIDVDGVRLWRAYSVTSRTDRTDGCLTIAVKAIPDGVVSNHLVRRAAVGTVIQLDQATGEFVLPPTTRPARALFVTAGSGITPVMGILRNAVDELADVVLLHSAPTRDDVIFGAELRAMAAAGRLTLIERHTDVDGMVAVDELADLVPDFAERATWVCGPTGMLDALEAHWASHNATLITERFRATVVVAGDGGTVSFTRTGTTVDADGATPILDAAENAGVLMPSGCRMGICYGCVLPLREGAVRDLRTGEITTATAHESGSGGVPIQTCISAAAGACDLDH